jgi:hypothetical protein
MKRFAVLLLLVPLTGFTQHPHEQEVQRALIELDRRGADFARGAPPQPLEPHAGQPLDPDPEIARQLRPYERMRTAEAYVLRLPPPRRRQPGLDPQPLPRIAD